MQFTASHSGEMSQGFVMENQHPKDVATEHAPAAKQAKRAYNALSASSVGLELGIAVIVGLLAGLWLDSHFGTSPWLMLVFLVLGLVAGFRNVIRAVARVEKAAKEDTRG
jgi:ATP synthase protein I